MRRELALIINSIPHIIARNQNIRWRSGELSHTVNHAYTVSWFINKLLWQACFKYVSSPVCESEISKKTAHSFDLTRKTVLNEKENSKEDKQQRVVTFMTATQTETTATQTEKRNCEQNKQVPENKSCLFLFENLTKIFEMFEYYTGVSMDSWVQATWAIPTWAIPTWASPLERFPLERGPTCAIPTWARFHLSEVPLERHAIQQCGYRSVCATAVCPHCCVYLPSE